MWKATIATKKNIILIFGLDSPLIDLWKKTAQAPDIRLLVVCAAKDYFRWSVESCESCKGHSTLLLVTNKGSLDSSAKAKVTDFNFQVRSDQYVPWFKISVYNVWGMDKSNCTQHIISKHNSLTLVKHLVCFENDLLKAELEVVHYQVQPLDRAGFLYICFHWKESVQ